MKSSNWLTQALVQGVLPPQAQQQVQQAQAGASWVVWGLSFAGAQLALVPLLALLAALFGGWLLSPSVTWLAALGALCAGVWLLRQEAGLFVTQLGLNALLLGQTLWLWAWRGPSLLALLGLLALQLGVAAAVRVVWVQRLLGWMGAGVVLLLPWALYEKDWWYWLGPWQVSAVMHYSLAILSVLWLLWVVLERRSLGQAWAAAVSAWADGWVVGILCVLALSTPVLWVLLGYTPPGSADVQEAGSQLLWRLSVPVLGQTLLVLASAALWWRQGRAQAEGETRFLLGLVYAALLLACLSGAHWGWWTAVATAALLTGRWRLLLLALVVGLWLLLGWYYALAWPLVQKAQLLALLGGGLGLGLWLVQRRRSLKKPQVQEAQDVLAIAAPTSLLAPAGAKWALLLAGVLALAVVQQDVQRKEAVIAQGQKVFIPLAPVDPRSLLQGDYMALRFFLPHEVRTALEALEAKQPLASHALVLARLDEKGIAQLQRLAAAGEVPSPPELLLPLKRLKGQWVVVTDAYFFPEGQGQPLAKALYGEFRVLQDGRALLVGLAGEELQALRPAD